MVDELAKEAEKEKMKVYIYIYIFISNAQVIYELYELDVLSCII